MQENSYRYLFPYEKIPPGSNVLIYGAGVLGQEYLKQILITGYCKIIGFVDKNYADYLPMVVPVFAPKQISKLSFDYVVIALRDGFGIPAIKQILLEQGVEESRIVYVLERKNPVSRIFLDDNTRGKDWISAYINSPLSAAFYLAGGFGDMLYHKRFIVELLKFIPDLQFDIYVVQNKDYIRWLYSDVLQMQNVIMDLGFRYSSEYKNYNISMSIFGPKFLEINYFNKEKISTVYPEFSKKIIRLEEKTKKEEINHTIPSAVAFYRRIYRGENCYTWLNYEDVFEIKDFHVSIPFVEKYEMKLQHLGLHRYITVNVGNGSNTENRNVAKAWPLNRFQKTVAMFKEKYPTISVIQVGASHEAKLKEADVSFMGEAFGFVAILLQNALFHLDIEGGLVHLASQIGTKCIVLFGPTLMAYNAYSNNINIKAGTCHGCYGLYPSADQCARHMKKPACMYAITPEIVMDAIEKYMESRVKKT